MTKKQELINLINAAILNENSYLAIIGEVTCCTRPVVLICPLDSIEQRKGHKEKYEACYTDDLVSKYDGSTCVRGYVVSDGSMNLIYKIFEQ